MMNQSLTEQIHRINLGRSFDARPIQDFIRQHKTNVGARFITKRRNKIVAPPLHEFIGGRRPPPPPSTVPHFRIGRVNFFTRQEERPNETRRKRVGPLTVYDIDTMTPLQPVGLHKERLYYVKCIDDIIGTFPNYREGGTTHQLHRGNYTEFIRMCSSAEGVPVAFLNPDFQLAQDNPAYKALYGTTENMEAHYERFHTMIGSVLSRNTRFQQEYSQIIASINGCDGIVLENVSVSDAPIQQGGGAYNTMVADLMDEELYGKFGVISSIGRLNELKEQDRMDELWAHKSNQEKKEDSCILSVILLMYARKLNQEPETDEDDTDDGGNPFTTPDKKPPRTSSLKTPYKERDGRTRTFRLGEQTSDEIRLTYESLCGFLGIEYKEQGGMGTTVRSAIPFFVHFKIGLKVFDVQHRLIYELPNEDYNYDIGKKGLPNCRVMIAHKHLYLLSDIELEYVEKLSIAHIKSEFQVLEKPPSTFIFRTKTEQKKKAQVDEYDAWKRPNIFRFVNDVETIIEIVKEVSRERDTKKMEFMREMGIKSKHTGKRKTGDKTISYEQLRYFDISVKLVVNDLYDLLISLVANGICPTLQYDSSSGNDINAMYFQYHSVRVIINDGGAKGFKLPISETNFEKFEQTHTRFKDLLIRKEFMSRYNDEVYAWEKNFPISPITKSFVSSLRGKERFSSIDISKAYTQCLKEMNYFPVFNEFDIWMDYDGHPLEDYTQYFVKVKREAIDGIFFRQKRCRVYGFHLKQMPEHAFPYIPVLFFKRPSHLAISGAREAIAEVWRTTIDSELEDADKILKKFIVNQTIGALSRVENHSSRSQVFVDYAEAMYYQTRYGGTVFAKQKSVVMKWVANDVEYDDLDGEDINNMKRHNKFVLALLDYINQCDTQVWSFHNESSPKTLTEMVEAFQDLLGEACLPIEIDSVSSFQLMMWLKRTDWFQKTIRAYISLKPILTSRFIQATENDACPSLDIFQRLLKKEKFEELRQKFYEPVSEMPLYCPLTRDIITEPWRNKYGRVFQRSQQLLDYIEKHQECPISHQPMTIADFQVVPQSEIPQRVYIWKEEHMTCLTQGFVPLKEFIYLSCRLKLFHIRQALTQQYGESCVVAVRTDALLIDNKLETFVEVDVKKPKQKTASIGKGNDAQKYFASKGFVFSGGNSGGGDAVEKKIKRQTATLDDVKAYLTSMGFVFGGAIGNLRIEHYKCLPEYAQIEVDVPKTTPPIQEFKEYQEYDDEYNIPPESVLPNTQILGLYAGVGKTTLTMKLFPDRPHYYATPYNRLSQELTQKSKTNPVIAGAFTVHRVIGERIVQSGVQANKNNAMKFAEGSVVIFDEIYLNSVKMLASIWHYMKQNPQVIFLATGDVHQLPPIEHSLNNLGGDDDDPKKIDEYYRRAVAQMFPNVVHLTKIKRLSDEKQILRIQKLYMLLFHSEETIKSILEQLEFRIVGDQEISARSICYFSNGKFLNSVKQINDKQQLIVVAERRRQGKEVCDIVRNKKQSKGGGQGHFYVWNDMIIVCRKSFVADKAKCYTNYHYQVVSIDKTYVYFCDMTEQEPVVLRVEKAKIHKHFQYKFAGTCHCYQGLSLEPGQLTTVLHANHAICSRKWVYVAITRAMDLDDLQFVLLDERGVSESERMRHFQYYRTKIERYKEQDKLAGRWNEDCDRLFVDAFWFQRTIDKGTHCKCGALFEVSIDPNTRVVRSNLSANRTDNRLPHLKENIHAMCVDCNKKLSNRENRFRRRCCRLVS